MTGNTQYLQAFLLTEFKKLQVALGVWLVSASAMGKRLLAPRVPALR